MDLLTIGPQIVVVFLLPISKMELATGQANSPARHGGQGLLSCLPSRGMGGSVGEKFSFKNSALFVMPGAA